MKIGIMIGSLGLGGAERVSVRLAEWWNARGEIVSFYTTKVPPEKEYQISPSITRICCHEKGGGLRLVASLRAAVRSDNPDIVIIMDTPMCVYAVPALLGTGIPFIVSERSDPKNAKIKLKTRILSHSMMRFANGFVFQTNGARNYYKGISSKRSIVIANPIVPADLPNPYYGKRKKSIVAMGRLIGEKNYPLLIRAFEIFVSSHSAYTLEIYGAGPEQETIEKLIQRSSAASQIHLNGARSDVLTCIGDAGIYVLSSDLEGMPNALIEALALGIPSISTNCPPGGPADLIVHGENGLLVEVGNEKELVTAMIRLADDDVFAHRIGKKAVEIRERLTIDVIGKLWLEFMERFVQQEK